MGLTAAFIDGGYLSKVLYHDHANSRINFAKLSQEMAGGNELLRAYYYNCLPWQGSPPSQEERDRYAGAHRFMTALKHLPRFEVRLGKLAHRGTDANGNPIFQQKRVDLMFGVDIALLAGKGRVDNVAMLTGDSDMIPAVEAVKREGILVTLWHGSNTNAVRCSRDLYEECDERRELDAALIDRIKR